MLTIDHIPTHRDLSEAFTEFLRHDTVANLKQAFSLMGRRFVGQPRKEQVAVGIAKYVREHPLDVLHKCNSESLMYIQKMIQMGKGSCITIGEPFVRGQQIQQMDLVLTYDDRINLHTEFYLLDDLHDLFAPHIDEAYRHPSPILMHEMSKALEDLAGMAKDCKTQDEFLAKFKEQFPDIDLGDEEEHDDDSNKEIDALLQEAVKSPSTQVSQPYSFSTPLMDDVRALHYKGQAAVCKLFHQLSSKEDFHHISIYLDRFNEDYEDIVWDSLEDSLDDLHYCVNDLDNVIYAIDMYEPMTFFSVASRLAPVIKLSQEKWKVNK